MIVKMKKLTILCRGDDKSATLNALRELGVLHLTPVKESQSADLDRYQNDLREARSIQMTIDSYRKKSISSSPTPPSSDTSPVMEKARDLLSRKQQALDSLAALRRERLSLDPYGDFDPATIRQLAEKGITVKLFHTTDRKPISHPEGTHLHLIRRDSRGQYFAIIGTTDFEFEGAEFSLPERSLEDVISAQNTTNEALRSLEGQLALLSKEGETIRRCVTDIEENVLYTEASEGMGSSSEIAYLRGFCPVDLVDTIRKSAATQGWCLIVDDPSSDDNVPTLIRNPAWVRPINILFKMLDILPGYSEVDIRSAFLIFFALFFAILVGDAGYGFIFLIIAIVARFKLKNAPPEPFRLLTLLSLCTIVWGAITGNYFGIAHLPAPLRGFEVPWMKDDKNLMAFSFLVGAIHLTIARAWAALQTINSTRALGQVGWICLSWVMYFLARNLILGIDLPSWFVSLFVAGLAMLILFMTPIKLLKKEWAGHVMLPFDVIGNFADLVSYVRLFAVGSAGLAVAVAFNELAVGEGINSWSGGVKAAIILFLGHTLNIILCLMSILVHGVRLNTLEFSRHVGLEWAGFRYKPFARHVSADA